MKTCAYCGREHEDGASRCAECGQSEFRRERELEGEAGLEAHVREGDYNWVTLTNCRNIVEADVIAMRLRASNIPVFIPDEFLSQAVSFNLNTYGFVRLQVPLSAVETARQILEGAGSAASSEAVD